MGSRHPRSENQGRRVRLQAAMIDRRRLAAVASAAVLAPLLGGRTAAAQAASVQGWPSRVVKLVVPFTPGGGIDSIGRILGARLTEIWGQQAVIENRPGAGGNIASEFVARSAPDGYTMYITAAGLAVNRYLFESINYDPLADFAPVTLICLFPNVLVVPNSSPLRSVGDLVAQAKGEPGKLTFASPGHGSSPHMSAELFKHMAKVNLTHVPYRGASPAYTDVIAGRVDCTFAVMASGLPLVRSGQLRALGVTTVARWRRRRRVQPSRNPACPATTRHPGSLSSCRPRRLPKSSPRCARTRSRCLPTRKSEPNSTRSASSWWAPRPNNWARISRRRWSGGRRSSRRPTSGSANDHSPSRDRNGGDGGIRSMSGPPNARADFVHPRFIGAELADPVRAPHRAVPAWRRNRRHRPRRRRQTLGHVGPADGGREPRRRRHQYRHRGGRARGSRRLHDVAAIDAARGEPLPVFLAQLRCDQRSRAGIASLRVCQHHGGAGDLARPFGRRIHRLCESQ